MTDASLCSMTIQEGEGVPSRATPRAYDSPSYWAARAQEAGTHCLERLPGPHAESATRCFRRRCSSSSCQRRFASSPARPVFALPRVQRGHAYPHSVEALHTTILPIDSATQPKIFGQGVRQFPVLQSGHRRNAEAVNAEWLLDLIAVSQGQSTPPEADELVPVYGGTDHRSFISTVPFSD